VNEAECKDLCTTHAECKAFVFTSQLCVMYGMNFDSTKFKSPSWAVNDAEFGATDNITRGDGDDLGEQCYVKSLAPNPPSNPPPNPPPNPPSNTNTSSNADDRIPGTTGMTVSLILLAMALTTAAATAAAAAYKTFMANQG
jgi:hypothetical protein